MTSVPPAAVYQQKVDVLRGWAALSVLIMHSYRQKLLPEFPLAHYASYLQADRAAVLLFFVISGYVIGLSNKQAWSPTGARGYAWRRLLRLGPVYMLAILLAWVAIPAENWRTVLGHLAFLQDSNADNPLRVDLLAANTPLWSLHYEALFYLLFLVWWRWPASVGPSLLLSVAAGIWATAATRAPGYVISHSVGSIFWLSGLLLSRCPPAAIANIPGKIIGGLLWLLAAYHFAPVPLLRAGLHLPAAAKTYMPLDDLIYLPLTVTLVAYAGGRRLPGGRLWHLVAFGTAAAGLLMILVAQKNLLDVRWLPHLRPGCLLPAGQVGPGNSGLDRQLFLRALCVALSDPADAGPDFSTAGIVPGRSRHHRARVADCLPTGLVDRTESAAASTRPAQRPVIKKNPSTSCSVQSR